MDQQNDSPEESLPSFDGEAVGQFEAYLRTLARVHARPHFKAKIGESDIVQQTMLQAVAAIDQFAGSTEAEFRGWLRKILAHHLCHLDRDMHRQRRDIRREQSMEQKLSESSMRLGGILASDGPTASTVASGKEQMVKVCDAIERLPDTQREAIELHYLKGMSLSEVAEALEKTNSSVAGLLHRGMKTLRESLDRRT